MFEQFIVVDTYDANACCRVVIALAMANRPACLPAKQLGKIVYKMRQNELTRLPVDSRRQAKGARIQWQYGEKWRTELRHEKPAWFREQMRLISQYLGLKELAKDIRNYPWCDKRYADSSG